MLNHSLRKEKDDNLDIFFRQVYCPFRFELISQHPFSLHVRHILLFSFPPTHHLDCFDLLTSYSIYFVLPTIFHATFI